MAARIETLQAPVVTRPNGLVTAPGRMLKAVGDWFRDGQIGSYSETELSRETGARA
jgi:hypothetical protein